MQGHAQHSQRGLSLLEMAMALALSAVVMAGIAWYAGNSREQVSLRNDAQLFSMVSQAAANYVEANRESLLTAAENAPSSGNSHRIVRVVSFRALQNGGFLDGKLAGRLGGKRNQSMTLLIRAMPVVQPTTLQGLLVSSGGTEFRDDELGQVVATAGAMAGYMPQGKAVITGANGGWETSTADWAGFSPSPSRGYLAALVTAGLNNSTVGGNSDLYLHRKENPDPNKSYLNRMDTAIDMNNNKIVNTSILEVNQVMPGRKDNSSESSDELVLWGPPRYVVGAARSFFELGMRDSQLITEGSLKLHGGGSKGVDIASVESDGNVASRVTVDIYNTMMNQGNARLGLYGGDLEFRMSRPISYVNASLTARSRCLRANPGGGFCYLDIDQSPVIPGQYALKVGGAVSARDFISTSDIRKKQDLLPLTGALDKLDKLQGYRFRWKEGGASDIGLIAQEVKQVYPEVVTQDDKGFLAVSYGNLIAPLIEAIKELHQTVIELQSKFKEMVTTLYDQKAEIDRLQVDLKQQRREFLQLKQVLELPLSVEERTLCGNLCMTPKEYMWNSH